MREVIDNGSMPKNMRQIGEPGTGIRILVEDYAYTYLCQLARENLTGMSTVILLGKIREDQAVCVQGAMELDMGQELEQWFSGESWRAIFERIKTWFEDLEIVGWGLLNPGFPPALTERLTAIHNRHFPGKYQVFFQMDILDNEEVFYVREASGLLPRSGYYIYYEKNPQMQAYMLEKNPELNQPEQELVADDAVKTFRKIIQKKHTEETQETEERASVFSYAATACLVLAVLTVGVQFYQNYNHKSITDTITETVSRTANSTEVTKAERQTEKKSVTPTSALKKDLTPIPVSPAATETPPVTSMAAEDDAETDTKNVLNSEKEQEIYREESDTRKAERRVKQEQVENNAAKNKISEDVTDSAVASSAESGTSYVIKPGDTLYQISISRYGTMEKVADICRANGLTEEEIIYPGQIIVLP